MKQVVYSLLFVAIALVFSSCWTYYHSTVRSVNEQVTINENESFSVTQNNITVTYSFQTQRGRIVYDIQNNSDDPLFMDWSRSALVADGKTISHRNDRGQISGSSITTTVLFSGSTPSHAVSSGHFAGSISIPQNELFIPPRARVSHSPMELSNLLNLDIPSSAFETHDIALGLPARIATFHADDSPLRFRSYLTIVNDRDGSQTVFEEEFYISQIMRMGSNHDFLVSQANRAGNRFITEVPNRRAHNWGWGIAAVAGVVLIILGSQ